MQKVFRILGFLGIAIGVLAYPLAFAIDRAAGADVILVSPRDALDVDLERSNWESEGKSKQPSKIAEIYGTPFEKGSTSRILSPKADVVVHPKEDPSLSLYMMAKGDHPIQAQTLYFFALYSTVGGLVAGALLLWLACRKGCAAKGDAPTPPAA